MYMHTQSHVHVHSIIHTHTTHTHTVTHAHTDSPLRVQRVAEGRLDRERPLALQHPHGHTVVGRDGDKLVDGTEGVDGCDGRAACKLGSKLNTRPAIAGPKVKEFAWK